MLSDVFRGASSYKCELKAVPNVQPCRAALRKGKPLQRPAKRLARPVCLLLVLQQDADGHLRLLEIEMG
ncbi:hypothetical protein CVIRNUC_007086 [Coccomyxa viridis]|uniref:Uncharacterized protein n=1 Tax=Coccomyxa viridis TaxID=1274662 RepID=A0AAV1I952_9CHLO|nr:hypothetical protein CVIRNUC_007086 [Coccomyxa viridis]